MISQRPRATSPQTAARSSRRTSLSMGSQAKFGIFSPAVYAAKLGELCMLVNGSSSVMQEKDGQTCFIPWLSSHVVTIICSPR